MINKLEWRDIGPSYPESSHTVLVLVHDKRIGSNEVDNYIMFAEYISGDSELEGMWKVYNGAPLCPYRIVPNIAIYQSGLRGWMPIKEEVRK